MKLVRYAEADLPTVHGPFRLFVYHEAADKNGASPCQEHMAIVRGPVQGKGHVLTRVHSECWTSEVMGSLKCDCREQFHVALEKIAAEGAGVLVYLRQEGRGIGLGNKIRAYALQSGGADTVEANERLGFASDLRSYELPAAILRYFGLRSVRLLSNNPEKVAAVEKAGIEVAERVPCLAAVLDTREAYLRTKKERMGHLLEKI